MAYYCSDGQRYFPNGHAIDQHFENSPVHNNFSQYDCGECQRSFNSATSLHQHCSTAYGHPYCVVCKRMFISEHNLMQHLHSRGHRGANIECPFCKIGFATASGMVIHLESGTCSKTNIDRQSLNNIIRRLDRNNVITKPMIELPGYNLNLQTIATDRAWNGNCYECYICHRGFGNLYGLNSHLKSPAHDQKIYRCPGRGCGREYKVLSGLFQHVESESCGVMRFETVQQQARNGVQNMVGRMIGY